MVYRFNDIEDYVEIMAGLREPNGRPTGFFSSDPLISLARYDMKVVPSLANQTLNLNTGYTDKQAQLAAQLVLKYEKQLARHSVDIEPAKVPQYRLPIRHIDRTSRVWLEDERIRMRFPYIQEYVEQVREATQHSQGSFEYDRDSRSYSSALTEYNLNWIYSFAQNKNFEIDPSVQSLMDSVLAVEQTPYPIELVVNESKLDITNAPESLQNYIMDHLGGFGLDNLFKLCDHAPLLGYTVNQQIEKDIIESLGPRFFSLCNNKILKSTGNAELAQQIIDYAQLVDRFPIYVYEPDLSDKLFRIFSKLLPADQICRLDNNNAKSITKNTRLVYVNKIPKKFYIDHIPIMISSAGMMFGGDRQFWIQSSQKVVYFSQDVYNKLPQGTQICRLD